jgi:hypothetical protein
MFYHLANSSAVTRNNIIIQDLVCAVIVLTYYSLYRRIRIANNMFIISVIIRTKLL